MAADYRRMRAQLWRESSDITKAMLWAYCSEQAMHFLISGFTPQKSEEFFWQMWDIARGYR